VRKIILFIFFSLLTGCSHAPENPQLSIQYPFDKEKLRAVVLAHLGEIKACFADALKNAPHMSGKVVIQWTIITSGNVSEAHIKSSDLKSAETENCALQKIKTWIFPSPPPNEVAVISYPFIFGAKD